MSRRDDISLQSGNSGSSRSSYSSAFSSGYPSSGYSGSSSHRGAVERHIDKHDNFALRIAQHCLKGPFASKRSTSQSRHHHKKQGSNYSSSSSSYKSSKKHQRSSRPESFSPKPRVSYEQVRTARGPPPPPPPASGWQYGGRPGAYATRQGFEASNAARQGARDDPIWSVPSPHGARRGQKPRRVVLVDE